MTFFGFTFLDILAQKICLTIMVYLEKLIYILLDFL